jgi:excisionase family DNA binding protein
MEPPIELLTPAEVATLLRVTPRTIRKWASEGRLDRVRLGGRLVRYTPQSVADLIHNDARPVGEQPGAVQATAGQGRHEQE